MNKPPYDRRIARVLVRPLARLGVTPNQVTAMSLVLALGAGALFAVGGAPAVRWAAGIFVLARFLDHFDGELARLTGNSSSARARRSAIPAGAASSSRTASICWRR